MYICIHIHLYIYFLSLLYYIIVIFLRSPPPGAPARGDAEIRGLKLWKPTVDIHMEGVEMAWVGRA